MESEPAGIATVPYVFLPPREGGMSILGWGDKLPVIRWLLDNADEAFSAIGHIQVILSDTDEATELKAIQDLVSVLHPVWWRSPFNPDADLVLSLADATEAHALALLPQAPDGSKLKQVIAFLVEHSDEAVQIILTLLALFGRKSVK